jgi:hypothetical protein
MDTASYTQVYGEALHGHVSYTHTIILICNTISYVIHLIYVPDAHCSIRIAPVQTVSVSIYFKIIDIMNRHESVTSNDNNSANNMD